MNRSESKYFATAQKMDEAFLALLEKKDFAYITVKEICQKADVNRSTFYLHYETIEDLLEECAQHIIKQFTECMPHDVQNIFEKFETGTLRELYLITPEYLVPYLEYVKAHRRVFRTVMEHAAVLRMHDAYQALYRHVLTPIMDRYGVPEADREYLMAFYIQGLMAIISKWLENDCKDSIDHMAKIMEGCVMPHKENET